MPEPRIALLLPRLSRYGGSEGFAWRLAERLAAEGYGVDYICGRRENPAPAGVRVRRVGRFGLTRAEKMLWFALAAEQLRRRGGYSLSIGLGKSLCQDILRIGGGPLPVFWEKSRRAYAAGLPRHWKMLRRRMAPSNTLTRIIEGRALARTPCIVAVSHLVGDWIRQAYPFVEPERLRVIYNRPDLSRFQPAGAELRARRKQSFGIAPESLVVGTAATNFSLKGTGFLIRALARLPEQFQLLVAGGRDPHRLERLAGELRLEGRVHFAGKVSDMPAFYAACDLFALPTFYDACSNAVLEALASGVPTISGKDNGSAYFLPPERVLEDPSDVGALAALLRETARTPPGAPIRWPDAVDAGLDPWMELVERMLPAGRTI